MRLLTILTFCVFTVGCGYGSHSMTPAPMLAVSQLSPSSATHGDPPFTLTVEGANFASGAVVKFNGIAMTTTFDNPSEVKASIPQSAIATAGTVPVTVTNPATGGAYGTPAVTSAPMNFTIN